MVARPQEVPLFSLSHLGWDPFFERSFALLSLPDLRPGRISADHGETYTALCEHGAVEARLTGRLRHAVLSRADWPAVGDWVAVTLYNQGSQALIHDVLPRKSKFSRQAAGNRSAEQLVATNVDTLFLVMALDRDFNLRRLERYLVLAWESGASPVVVLTKADLCPDWPARVSEVAAIATGAPVHGVSVRTGEGLEALAEHLAYGRTVALLGSSGVGKSSLINYWLGEEVQAVREVRADDARGRHTTSHRELFVLPSGALVIDTPGMRELQLWEAEDGVEATFEDVRSWTEACRFRDCRHQSEPGCAIRRALEAGDLSAERWQSYQKVRREAAYQARKEDLHEQLKEKERWKSISKQIKRLQ